MWNARFSEKIGFCHWTIDHIGRLCYLSQAQQTWDKKISDVNWRLRSSVVDLWFKIVKALLRQLNSQQTRSWRYDGPMLSKWRASIEHCRSTINQPEVNVLCWLEMSVPANTRHWLRRRPNIEPTFSQIVSCLLNFEIKYANGMGQRQIQCSK